MSLMREYSFQIVSAYDSGGHDEKAFRKTEWSGYGAIEDLMSCIKRMTKDPQTKGLKSLSITLNAK